MTEQQRPACLKCGKDAFELRMLKDEAVATVRCVGCGSHFLVLDSGDYWFDVIQTGYPRITRCSCKSTAFQLQLEYYRRDDGDVELIRVGSRCTACGKTQRRMNVEIDYSPTQRLIQKPLTRCKNPEMMYDLKELSLYARAADIARVADYLAEQGCSFAGVVRQRDDWVLQVLSPDEATELIARKVSYMGFYLQVYAMPRRIALTEETISTSKKESTFWKRHEVIRIDSPTSIGCGSRTGQLHYIHYSNEFIDGGKVVAKSGRFRKLTDGLIDWLGKKFVTWRGADCFDNEKSHRRLFGKKFLGKTSQLAK
jgi:DNA-directed RNA polymerase subunit RPC12/RpoP